MNDGANDQYNVLKLHSSLYPYMAVQDAVKLLYQSEFGCEHMVISLRASYARLRSEFDSIRQAECPLLVDIGNGFSRINLRALNSNGVTIEQVFDWFAKTASESYGSIDNFKQSLRILTSDSLDMPFTKEEAERFIAAYTMAGYPLVHHSARYMAAYAPAYRVIRTEYAVSYTEGEK